MPMQSHTDRVAVITGGAGGFGRAMSLELARRGADLILVDLAPADDIVAEIKELGRDAIALQADVSSPESIDGIAEAMLGFKGRVDILVNNAGIFPFIDLFDVDYATWKRLQAVNIDSMFLMSKAVWGSMIENKWGRIVNIASNSLGMAVPGMAHYMATKGAAIGFTRALATDLAPYGITVNALAPTASATPGGKRNIGEMLEEVAQLQAIKRVGVAEDIAGTICYLTSDDCAFQTGQTLVVDGGLWRI